MRILLINPDYPTSFWSFDSVLELLGKRAHSPPLGLLTMASMLPEDWDVKLVDERLRHVEQSDWDNCDVAFIGGMHVQCMRLLANIREGKKQGKTVVVGGTWVFHTPDEAFEAGADIVVIGEGETAMPRVIEALQNGESEILLNTHELPEIEESPLPRFDLLEMDQYLQMSVQTTRGCPFKCDFCDVTLMNGRKARTKNPEQVIREIQAYYDLGWRRDIFVVDDTFNATPKRAKALLDAIIPWQEEREFPFGLFTQCSVNVADNPELLDLMGRAGFIRVFLGIESTEEDAHILSVKTQNTKTDLVEACRTLAKYGISVIAGCIVGFDNETPGADKRFIQFAAKSSVPDMFLTILQAPPGTDLWKRLEREGRQPWMSYDDDQGGSCGIMNFEPTRPINDIVEEFVNCYQVLYEPAAYLERLYEHFSLMPPLQYKKKRRILSAGEKHALKTIFYRRGIACSDRFTFWKVVFKALWNFPKRFDRFIASLIFFEHLHSFRQTVTASVRRQVADREASKKAHLDATTSIGVGIAAEPSTALSV